MLKSLLPFLLLTTPAAAQTQPTAPSVRVNYADLDLSRPSGRHLLDWRIARAVERVCPPMHRELERSMQARACQKEARARVAGRRAAVLAPKDSAIRISAVP